MAGEVREFLSMSKASTESMSLEELVSECEGWRLVMGMLPREIMEWLARMHEVVRFTKRNYQGHIGVLLGVKFVADEYVIGLDEAAFDSLHGRRVLESKQITLPASAVMYFECINDSQPYDPDRDDEELSVMTLDYEEAINGTT